MAPSALVMVLPSELSETEPRSAVSSMVSAISSERSETARNSRFPPQIEAAIRIPAIKMAAALIDKRIVIRVCLIVAAVRLPPFYLYLLYKRQQKTSSLKLEVKEFKGVTLASQEP